MLEVMAFAPGMPDFLFFHYLTDSLFRDRVDVELSGAAQPQQNGGAGGNGRGRKHNRFLIKLESVNL